MSAKEASEGYAKTAKYISHLQGALVDKINREVKTKKRLLTV